MNASIIAVLLAALFTLTGCEKHTRASKTSRTFSSFDQPTTGEKIWPPKAVLFQEAALAQVLDLYAEISKRDVIRSANLPDVKITFTNQRELTTPQLLQALDTVLAAQGVVAVYLGTEYVKAVPVKEVTWESPPVIDLPPDQLPESSSPLIYIVRLKNHTPSEVQGVVSPFTKLPNSVIAVRGTTSRGVAGKSQLPNLPIKFGRDDNILILRDYSSNVRTMLRMIEEMEKR